MFQPVHVEWRAWMVSIEWWLPDEGIQYRSIGFIHMERQGG